MRFNIVFAILASIVLIGGASWVRFARTNPFAVSYLAIVPNQLESENDILESFLNPKVPDKEPALPLSQTDILGRQLFSDYMALKSRDQLDSNSLKSLINKYSGGILSFESRPSVSKEQINIVPDSTDNSKIYIQKIFETRAKYAGLVVNSFGQRNFTDIDDPDFKELTAYAAKLYQEAAAELKKIPVPVSLADNHIKLIENYLSSSSSIGALSNIAEDPARTYAALNTYAQNVNEEERLLANIQLAILTNGI